MIKGAWKVVLPSPITAGMKFNLESNELLLLNFDTAILFFVVAGPEEKVAVAHAPITAGIRSCM